MDENLKLSPYIRVAWNDYQNTPWVVGPRVIFDYEILYLAEGELKLTVEGIAAAEAGTSDPV